MSATPSVVPPVNQLVVLALPYKAPPVVAPWPKKAPPALPRGTPSSSNNSVDPSSAITSATSVDSGSAIIGWPARRIAWPKIAPPPPPEESFSIQQAFIRKRKWAFWTVRLIERHYNGVMSDAMHSQIVKLTLRRHQSVTYGHPKQGLSSTTSSATRAHTQI